MSATINAYGNIDALHGIFNSIVMVMGGADYKDAVRIAITIGFAVAAIAAVNQQHRSWQWVVTVMVIYQLMFVPKETVVIQDRTGPQVATTVGNVPFALAFFASLKSSFGWVLTSLFETGFQTIPSASRAMPADLSYSSHGLMFGNSLLRAARSTDLMNPTLRSDVINFFQNCTVPDLMDGTINPATFFNNTDLWSSAGPGNPARFTTINTNTGTQTKTCPDAYTDLNTNRVATGVTDAISKAAQGLYPSLSSSAAVTAFTAALPAAYTKFGISSASTSVASLIRQNIMINLFAETGQIMNVNAGSAEAVMLATAQSNAVVSTNSSYIVQARLAEEALPIIRNIFEAIIYAMFPLIVLLMLTVEGEALKKMAKGYLFALLWVELWPVLYAVVNFIGTTYAAQNVAAAAVLNGGGTGMAISSASDIYRTTISDQAVVGWMTVLIPAIAGAVLWGFDRISSAINVGGFLSGVGSAAGSAMQGNVSMGNASMDQQSMAPTYSSPFMSQRSDLFGTTTVANAGSAAGQMRYTTYTGSSPIQIHYSKQDSEQFAAQSAKEQSAGEASAKQADTAIRSAFNDVQTLLRDSGKMQQLGGKYGFGSLGSDGLTALQSKSVRTELANRLGLKDSSAVREALTLGVSVPDAIKKLSPIALGANGQRMTDEQIGVEINKARNTASQLATENRISVVDNFTHSTDFADITASNQRAGHNIQAGLEKSKGYHKTASASFQEASKFQERAEKATALSRGWTANDTVAWNNFLNEKGILGTGLENDIRRMAPLVDEFLDRGSLTPDGKGGFMFVASHGEGPNLPTKLTPTTYASDAKGNSPLRAQYIAAKPQAASITPAEAAPVLQDNVSNNAKVATARTVAGVSGPETVVSGDEVKTEVAAQKAAAEAKAAPVTKVVQGEQELLEKKLADRSVNLSPSHENPLFGDAPKVFSEVERPYSQIPGRDSTPPDGSFSDTATREWQNMQDMLHGTPREATGQVSLREGDHGQVERAAHNLSAHSTKHPNEGHQSAPKPATEAPAAKQATNVPPLAQEPGARPPTHPTLTPQQREAKVQQLLHDRKDAKK